MIKEKVNSKATNRCAPQKGEVNIVPLRSIRRYHDWRQAVFERLDLNRDGRISRGELEQLVSTFAPNISITEKEAVFRQFDKDDRAEIAPNP